MRYKLARLIFIQLVVFMTIPKGFVIIILFILNIVIQIHQTHGHRITPQQINTFNNTFVNIDFTGTEPVPIRRGALSQYVENIVNPTVEQPQPPHPHSIFRSRRRKRRPIHNFGGGFYAPQILPIYCLVVSLYFYFKY
jgi:hypothetical protein